MKVKEVLSIKGKGTIVVVDNCPPEVRLGDVVTSGSREWIIVGADGIVPPGSRQHETGLALKEVDGITQGYPVEGEELTVKQLPLMKREVGRCTLEELVEALGRASTERQELAGILKDLSHAINHLELVLNRDGRDDEHSRARMGAFKNLRETFNKVPPKWFHR